MNTRKITVGNIFKLSDHMDMTTESGVITKHMYIVIGTPNQELGMYQLMCITSMRNKEVTMEVPIIINDKVTYIVPYNIHSFSETELTHGEFIGSIEEDSMSNFTIKEFINMLLNLFYNKTDTDNQTLLEYDYYCTEFQRVNKKIKEYRTGKEYKYSPLQAVIDIHQIIEFNNHSNSNK